MRVRDSIRRFVVVFLLLSPPLVWAQSGQFASVRVLAINVKGIDLYYKNHQGNYRSLEITPYRIDRYRRFALEGGKIRVYRKEIVEEKEVYPVAAEASMQSPDRPHTMLLRTSPNECSMELIDDSFETDDTCELRLLNRLPVPIMIKIGKTIAEVEPGGSTVLPVVHKRRRPVVPIIAVYRRIGGELESFFSGPKVILRHSRMTAIAIVKEPLKGTRFEGLEQLESSEVQINLFTYTNRPPRFQ